MNILSVNTPKECIVEIARRIRDLRLGKNYSQEELALKAGIKPATYIYFERTGKISFERLVKILMALGRVDDLDRLVKPVTFEELEKFKSAWPMSSPGLINLYDNPNRKQRKPRKRGRRLHHAN